MNNDYTHIAMIIDRSGSMSSCWNDVKGGYTEIVKQNKAAPGKCTFTVAAFDTDYDTLEDFTDIQSVKENLTVNPRGSTALLDAIGRTIVSVGEKLAALKEEDRPSRVMVIVQTDGEENSSREFTKEEIKELVENQTNKYNWQFQFIGASLASVNEATTKWGFQASKASTYNTGNSQQVFATLGTKMAYSRGVDISCYASTTDFTESEKTILNSAKVDSTETDEDSDEVKLKDIYLQSAITTGTI